MTLSICSTKNCLQRRLLAAERGFRIQATGQKLFTTIFSKTCTQHIHNFLKPVPYILCFEVQPLRTNVIIWFCFGNVSFKKLRYQDVHLALRGTPAANTTITCLCSCLQQVFLRERGANFGISYERKTKQKESNGDTSLQRLHLEYT